MLICKEIMLPVKCRVVDWGLIVFLCGAAVVVFFGRLRTTTTTAQLIQGLSSFSERV